MRAVVVLKAFPRSSGARRQVLRAANAAHARRDVLRRVRIRHGVRRHVRVQRRRGRRSHGRRRVRRVQQAQQVSAEISS